MRFRLRTLLILLAVGPMVLWIGWIKYEAWRAQRIDADAAWRALEQIAPEGGGTFLYVDDPQEDND